MKWGLLATAALCALAVVLAGAALAVLSGTVPPLAGSATIETLDQDTRLARTATGVRIEAASHKDALAALGFAHAQDRFWQMHLLRRAARGQLAAVLGRDALDSDRFALAVDFVSAAKRSYAAMGADKRALLDAYVAGVNTQLERPSRSLQLNMPPEILVSGLEAEPWTPTDSLAILRMMVLLLSTNPQAEIDILQLQAQGLNPQEVKDMLPSLTGVLPDLANRYALNRPFPDKTRPVDQPWPLGPWLAGKPALHLRSHHQGEAVTTTVTQPNRRPSALHKAVMGVGEDSMAMLTLPGLPVPLVGQTEDVFFSARTHFLDTVNIRIEQVRGNPPVEVLTTQGWRDTRRAKLSIPVFRGADTAFERVDRGDRPFLPPEFGRLNRILTVANRATLDWAGASAVDTTMSGLLTLRPGGSADEFSTALERSTGVSLAMQFVRKTGQAKLVATGQSHAYGAENPIGGRAPSPGWLAPYETKAETPLQSRYGFSHSAWGADDGRPAPLQNLLDLRDVLLSTVEIRPQTTTLLNDLSRWTGREADPWQPVFLTLWHKHLVRRMLNDDLEALSAKPLRGGRSPLISILGEGGARNWCDDQGTPDVFETCEGQTTAALDAALAEMNEEYGEARSPWRWSKTVRRSSAHLGAANGTVGWALRRSVDAKPLAARGLPPGGLPVDPWRDELTLGQNSDLTMTLNRATFDARMSQIVSPSGNPLSSRYGTPAQITVPLMEGGQLPSRHWVLSPPVP
ncbi:MAG: penicillin acylase family protein [Pseudomonadota bacterium]